MPSIRIHSPLDIEGMRVAGKLGAEVGLVGSLTEGVANIVTGFPLGNAGGKRFSAHSLRIAQTLRELIGGAVQTVRGLHAHIVRG